MIRMRRRRAGVAEQDSLRTVPDDPADDLIMGKGTQLGVEQRDVVSRIDQRPSHRQQPQRRKLLAWNPAADREVRHIDKENAQVAIAAFSR